MIAVLDASAFAPVVIADERDSLLPGLVDALTETGAITVPPHWRIEVANMILVASRRGRLKGEELTGAIHTAEAVIVDVDHAADESIYNRTWALAQQHRLTIYDAAYLELAIRRHLPLATHDRQLRTAAKNETIALLP